jgi:uncharacterized DUF497 family protein
VIDVFGEFLEFEWDRGNAEKSWKRHRVTVSECEQVFFNKPLAVSPDPGHSSEEIRFFAFGKTDSGRGLAVVFTIRRGRIRVVTAREISRREKRTYETSEKENPEVQK